MPPPDNTPDATITWLNRLLAAVALMHPDETIRIPQGLYDRIVGESRAAKPRFIYEDYDDNTNEIMLRFRPSSLATYSIVEVAAPCPPQSLTAAQTEGTNSPQPTTSSVPSTSQPPGKSYVNPLRPQPLTMSDEQLARAETAARQERFRRALERRQSQYGSPSDGNL